MKIINPEIIECLNQSFFSERELLFISERYIQKKTLQVIGDSHHLTRERIRQIIKCALERFSKRINKPLYL